MPFEPRLIRSASDLEECRAEIMLLRARADGDAATRRELLELLVRLYEEQQLAARATSALDAIQQRMQERGLRQRDVAPWLGGRNRASEVLRGKRALTTSMIATLSRELDIPASILLANLPARKRTPREGK